MKSTDHVGITFANLVLASGTLNGVVNVTLGAYEFNPDDKNEKVEPSPVIVSRLRLDVPGAEALYEALGKVLETVKASAVATATAEADGATAPKH